MPEAQVARELDSLAEFAPGSASRAELELKLAEMRERGVWPAPQRTRRNPFGGREPDLRDQSCRRARRDGLRDTGYAGIDQPVGNGTARRDRASCATQPLRNAITFVPTRQERPGFPGFSIFGGTIRNVLMRLVATAWHARTVGGRRNTVRNVLTWCDACFGISRPGKARESPGNRAFLLPSAP